MANPDSGSLPSLEVRRINFKVVQFMYESGVKLGMKSLPLATAAHVYHQVFQQLNLQDYDPYLIATTSLYLASKIEEDHKKIRDVINVCYRALHKDKPALDIGNTYWNLRDSLTQCELFIMRVLEFKVSYEHPHKYLLYFMKALQDWLDPEILKAYPFTTTAWAMLRDSYHGNLCLHYKPQHLAVAVLYFALQCHGLEVPGNATAKQKWWQVFAEDLKLDVIRQIIRELIALYELEKLV